MIAWGRIVVVLAVAAGLAVGWAAGWAVQRHLQSAWAAYAVTRGMER
jgi:hypothetical protein